MPVYRVRNAILVTQPDKRARSRSSGGGSGKCAKPPLSGGRRTIPVRNPSGPRTRVPLSGDSRKAPQLASASACDAVDLIGLDDDTRGRYWRTHYSAEIRRKYKGETSGSYSIVYKGVNADGDYYEIIEWNPMFLKQNKNTYRYWNNDGSFYECYPDWSDYYSRQANHERYITPKYGGFIRGANTGAARVCKTAPYFEALVLERGLNDLRGPKCLSRAFEPPWVTKRRKTTKPVSVKTSIPNRSLTSQRASAGLA